MTVRRWLLTSSVLRIDRRMGGEPVGPVGVAEHDDRFRVGGRVVGGPIIRPRAAVTPRVEVGAGHQFAGDMFDAAVRVEAQRIADRQNIPVKRRCCLEDPHTSDGTTRCLRPRRRRNGTAHSDEDQLVDRAPELPEKHLMDQGKSRCWRQHPARSTARRPQQTPATGAACALA